MECFVKWLVVSKLAHQKRLARRAGGNMEPGPAAASSAPSMSAAVPYAAPAITLPTAEDETVSANRKLVARALDTKVSQQDSATAMAAIELLLKLANNIIANPDEPKYRQFRSNNPKIRQAILRCPGGQDVLLALGFRTKVVEFEEHWVADETPVLIRTLAESVVVLQNYRDLEQIKIDRLAKVREQKLAGANDERQKILMQIKEDEAERREQARLAHRSTDPKAAPKSAQ